MSTSAPGTSRGSLSRVRSPVSRSVTSSSLACSSSEHALLPESVPSGESTSSVAPPAVIRSPRSTASSGTPICSMRSSAACTAIEGSSCAACVETITAGISTSEASSVSSAPA